MDKGNPRRYRLYSDWFFSPLGTKGIKHPGLKKEWRGSVQEHYENNPHHYHKIGKEQPLENQLEALADWYSDSKTKGDTILPFKDWYVMNREKLPLTGPARIIADYKLLDKKPEGPYFG